MLYNVDTIINAINEAENHFETIRDAHDALDDLLIIECAIHMNKVVNGIHANDDEWKEILNLMTDTINILNKNNANFSELAVVGAARYVLNAFLNEHTSYRYVSEKFVSYVKKNVSQIKNSYRTIHQLKDNYELNKRFDNIATDTLQMVDDIIDVIWIFAEDINPEVGNYCSNPSNKPVVVKL